MSFIQIPSSTGNSGPKVGTIEKVEGADTVSLHRVVTDYPEAILGMYDYSSGPITVAQTAHAADDGHVFLLNPVGSPVVVSVRRIRFFSYPTSTSTTINVPLLRLERFTFTGTPSGASATPARRQSANPAATASMRLASTGLTITPGNVMREYIVPLIPSGGGNVSDPIEFVWEPLGSEGEVTLLAGEGLVLRQDTNGTGSDPRNFIFSAATLEY